MAKFMFEASYTVEGVKGLIKEGGSSRKAEVEKLIQSVGGTLEALYFTFGDSDIMGIIDLPDNASGVALSLIVNSSGAVSVKTTPLITVEEVDTAVKLHPSYQAPHG